MLWSALAWAKRLSRKDCRLLVLIYSTIQAMGPYHVALIWNPYMADAMYNIRLGVHVSRGQRAKKSQRPIL